jgi:hypothetical protein
MMQVMLVASVFILGMYVGRVTLTHPGLEVFLVLIWVVNAVVWALLLHREERRANTPTMRQVIETIKRNQEGRND